MSTAFPIDALASLSPQAQALVTDANAVASARENLASPNRADRTDPAAGSFGAMVTNGLAGMNAKLFGNQVDLQKLAVGDAHNLHQIMINLEESQLSFQLMMQARNRMLEAYQDIMKMPL